MTEVDRDGERPAPEAAALAENWARIAERSQRLVRKFLERHPGEASSFADPGKVLGSFMELGARMLSDPARLIEAQMELWQDHMRLWQHTAERLLGKEPEPVAAPAPEDRRFRHEAWEENALFDYIKQSYLLAARWLQATVAEVEGLDEKTARKVAFYTGQFADAMAPTNFVLTNPQVLEETLRSKGENLVRGLDNLLGDLERGEASPPARWSCATR
jgi:polyhydroxyalkanoate synthase